MISLTFQWTFKELRVSAETLACTCVRDALSLRHTSRVMAEVTHSQVAEPDSFVLLLHSHKPKTREIQHEHTETVHQIQQTETPPVTVGGRSGRDRVIGE